MDNRQIAAVVDFWFVECDSEQWFKRDADFDRLIASRFSPLIEAALAEELIAWRDSADGCLALILLLDQFTRNIYRDTPRAFAGDASALAINRFCIDNHYLTRDNRPYSQFMLVPMMHSEDIAIQDESLPLFEKYANKSSYAYAVRHRDIVARFGRFPHRNKILGRSSTAEEIEFLKQAHSSF